jgi:type IV secretory pathway VirJ component
VRKLLALLLVMWAIAGSAEPTLSHGRFENVRIAAPAQRPQQFVMLLADGAADGERIAAMLADKGALVATIDTRALFSNLMRDTDDCVSPDGDLENLAHYIQAVRHLDAYHTPILVGDGAGAAFVYAMLAQSPPDTFAGGISLHFCPELQLRKPLCEDHRLEYAQHDKPRLAPARLEHLWVVLNASNAQCAAEARQFVQRVGAPLDPIQPATLDARLARAYIELASTVRPVFSPVSRQVADLPLVEVPTTKPGDTFAVMLSGDGGWAGIDKAVAGAIANAGIPVIGVDSLRYFWTERTPEGLARDLTRIVHAYTGRWQRNRVVLIGYSQGADALPFAINRLDAKTRALVSSAVLIGLAERAQFEFRLSNWIGFEDDGLPTAPEMQRLPSMRVVCIYGADDAEARCNEYEDTHVRVIELPGAHHFNGDYAGLARVIMREIEFTSPVGRGRG